MTAFYQHKQNSGVYLEVDSRFLNDFMENYLDDVSVSLHDIKIEEVMMKYYCRKVKSTWNMLLVECTNGKNDKWLQCSDSKSAY